ncbi:MAG: hypothetical protein AAB370_05105 [Verrucomicrobiota bacterium]
MKLITRIVLGCAVGATIFVLAGCATSEKPNYQGHKGTSPTVHDYYPPKTNSTPNR